MISILPGTFDEMEADVHLPERLGIYQSVVETNAVFARDRITPLLAGELTPEIRALTLPHVENQARTLRAALDCDPAPVAKTFLRDPNTRAKCRDRGALEALAADMIAATARYLPERWQR